MGKSDFIGKATINHYSSNFTEKKLFYTAKRLRKNMADSISQDGSGNIVITDVRNSEINILIGKSYEYNELREQLSVLEKSLANATPENTDWLNELNDKIAEKKEQIEQFKQGVIQLAETFSRIEVDSDRLKRAREFFDKGEFGEARAVLETELEQMNDAHKFLLAQKEKFETDTLPKLKHNAEEFLVLAQSTAVNFENPNRFEDTCKYYEQSIAAYPFFDNLFNYAILLQEHNQFHLAEPYYQRILREFRTDLSIENYATTLNNLAVLHDDWNEYETAEAEYTEALQIRQELAEKNPQAYLQDVANTLNNLAVLHYNRNEHEAAEAKYIKALQIYRELAEKSPQTYLPNVANTLNNLAVLHDDRNEHEAAEAEYTEALQIYRGLADNNPQVYLLYVATTLNNLGELHRVRNEFEAAEAEYIEALQIRRELAEKNPQAYLLNVANTLNNLALLHRARNEYEAAEAEYTEALQIYRNLAEKNPQTYLPHAARTLNNLAVLHYNRNEHEAAEAEYDEALKIRRELAGKNPQAYLPDVAVTLINLAIFYRESKPEKERSIALAIEAVQIISPFVERVPYTQKYLAAALGVLKDWGMTEEEIGELIENG